MAANLFQNSLRNFKGLTVIKAPTKIVQERIGPIVESHTNESESDGDYLEEEEEVVTSDSVEEEEERDEYDDDEPGFQENGQGTNMDLDSGVCGTGIVGMSKADVTSASGNDPIADSNSESLVNPNEGQENVAGKLASDEGINLDDPVNEALCSFELNSSFEREHSFITDSITGQVVIKRLTPSELVEIDRIRVVNALDAIDPVMETTHEYRRQLHLKKFVFIDLSGTLHIENESTPGAIRALMLLRANGYRILFLTNTTKESRAKLHRRLLSLGFVVDVKEIFTSMNATREYVVDSGLRPSLMISQDALEDFDGVETSDPNCVVIGLAQNYFNHAALTAAHRLVMENDGQIIAIHKGKKYLSGDGMKMGPGGFVTALEFSTNKTAIVLGKPSSAFYEAALKYVGCTDTKEAVMIGDDIRDDVYGAMLVGILGILVKTGKFTPDDIDKIYPHKPDIVCTNFSEAVQLLIDEKKYLSPKS